ncbi:MAG: signal peptidase I, partial [bacterium]|nr:signal peptidase I [bacterium]
MRQFFASVLEIFEIALIALGAVFLIRTFLIQPFLVSGASMAPNFENGDYLLIDELTYRFRSPERGEVIVFRYPKDPTTYFIKRIIGLPGERAEIKENKITIYNAENPQGFVLDENYLSRPTAMSGSEEFTIQDNEYL